MVHVHSVFPSVSLALAAILTSPSVAAQGAGGTLVFNSNNGHYYEVVNATVAWDQARFDAELVSHLGVPGHLVTLENAAEDNFIYFTLSGASLGNAWIGLYQDTSDPGYAEPLGGWKWVTGEALTYSNWTTGEPNDGGAAEHYGGYWPADKWNDYRLSDAAVTKYVIEYDTSAAVIYCTNQASTLGCPCGNAATGDAGCANSTGAGASVIATGSSSLGQANLGFQGLGLIPGGVAVLFEGNLSMNGGNGFFFGDGLRCAGAGVRRLGMRTTDAFGFATWTSAQLPSNLWNTGDIRRFQVWYSDSQGSPCGTGFNTSNGLQVSFVP